MNLFRIQILNYLSDDPQVRDIRLRTHHEQLKWWTDRTQLDITVYAMNYSPGDYFVHPRVTYRDLPKTPTGQAYNLRFEDLYASDYNYGIMMDDDAILYDHSSSYRMFEEMSSHITDYWDIDVMFPICPARMPFNHLLTKHKGDVNHIFIPNKSLKGTMYVVKNFRKFSESELYTDPSFTLGEDVQTAFEALCLGKHVYMTPSMVLKEYNHKSSHFVADHNTSGSVDGVIVSHKIADKYAGFGLQYDGSRYNTREFMKKIWPDKKTLLIPKNGVGLDPELWG